MPSHHIWIRKEDEAKWRAIADKPEWLHEHLNYEKPFRAMNLHEQVQHVKGIIDDPEPFTEAKMKELMKPIEELADKPGTGVYSDKNLNKMFDNVLEQRIAKQSTDPTYTEPESTA